jgi:hypothetical protein
MMFCLFFDWFDWFDECRKYVTSNIQIDDNLFVFVWFDKFSLYVTSNIDEIW